MLGSHAVGYLLTYSLTNSLTYLLYCIHIYIYVQVYVVATNTVVVFEHVVFLSGSRPRPPWVYALLEARDHPVMLSAPR